MKLISGYMNDDFLRQKLNILTQKTFGFDFENWINGGYFEGDYIPYSFIQDGKILANVSVNRMQFMHNETLINYIQLGTVMTDLSYQRQGLAAKLIQHVLQKYEKNCDGIYLFANLNALDFYRKNGFKEGLEYQYELKKDWLNLPQKGTPFQKASPQDRLFKRDYMNAVRNCAACSSFEHINKYGLQMFYTADLNNVYYAQDIGCYAVMDSENDTLFVQSIISQKYVPLADIVARIPVRYSRLIPGFTPCPQDADMFESAAFQGGEDYRFFYRGKNLERIETDRLCFPHLSHA